MSAKNNILALYAFLALIILITTTMKTITYTTHGTCARYIEVSGENGVITNVKFYGGCNGNLQGISKLVTGMKYEDVIARLKGISCNGKPTSCPDQLCLAIEELMREE